MKQRFFALCALAALAVCCLAGAHLLGTPEPSAVLPAPSADRPDRPILAFFGSSADPWCEGLFDELDRWAEAQGWDLVSYDCQGDSTAQKGQVEDLVRTQEADVAVVYALGDAEQLVDRARTLSRGKVPAVALSRQSLDDVEGVTCRVCPEDGEPFASVADWFPGGELLLLADLPDDPAVETVREALEDNGLRVLDYGACWGNADYAGDYVTRALERFPQADGVVAFSRAGALGAKDALGDGDEKVLCLAYGPAVEEDLALGRIDAAVEIPAQSALRALETCIPKVRDGNAEERYPLDVHIHTRRADT